MSLVKEGTRQLTKNGEKFVEKLEQQKGDKIDINREFYKLVFVFHVTKEMNLNDVELFDYYNSVSF